MYVMRMPLPRLERTPVAPPRPPAWVSALGKTSRLSTEPRAGKVCAGEPRRALHDRAVGALVDVAALPPIAGPARPADAGVRVDEIRAVGVGAAGSGACQRKKCQPRAAASGGGRAERWREGALAAHSSTSHEPTTQPTMDTAALRNRHTCAGPGLASARAVGGSGSPRCGGPGGGRPSTSR